MRPIGMEQSFYQSVLCSTWLSYLIDNVGIALFIGILCLSWIAFKRNTNSGAENFLNAIPGPSAFWFCFTVLRFSIKGSLNVDLQQLLSGLSHVYKKSEIYRLWLGYTPIVVFYKAETVEPFLNNDAFLERPPEYQYASPLIGYGLITSSVEKWWKRRRLLNPAFHYRILEECMPTFNKESTIMIEQLKLNGSDKAVDIVPYVQKCALDIICETAMGTNIGAQQGRNVKYVQALHTLTQILPERVMQPWLHPDFIFYNLPIGKKFLKNLKVVRDFTQNIIAARKETLLRNPEIDLDIVDKVEGAKRKLAFLDLLLYHHLHDKELTEDEIQGEVDTFMFAGHDTASVSVPWALFMIGNDAAVQHNIHRELDAIFQGDKTRPITLNDLREMNYLKCVCKETLRLYPPGGVIGRLPTKDVNIKGYTIPAGTRCLLFLYQLHRDPRYFPNPEAFMPERFFSSNLGGGHPYAYIPFSAGPRNCIGQRYAQYEQLTLLANILRNFSVKSQDSRDKIKLSIEVVLRPATPLSLYLTPR